MAFVGLPATERLRAEHRRLAAAWRAREARWLDQRERTAESELRAYVGAYRDGELHAWACERMERQLEQAPFPVTGALPTVELAPLSALELSERESEQRQLLEQMRKPGERAPEELETLERRLVEGAGELVRRQAHIRRLTPRGSRARVTFLMPHQRQTTGGVYVIEQFARHLAAIGLEVTLAVRGEQDATRAVPGVEVRAVARLGADELPTAEVLVYPADMRDAQALHELPDSVGRRVMFFQGYGTPGSSIVEANIEGAETSVAIAHWLVDVALGQGSPCAYVPQGLDRAIFHPGPSPAERPPRISLMTHRLDWKGLEDGLAAVSLVRRARPEIEVLLFGTEQVAAESGIYLASPTRAEVATLLRSSAVHIVASWEEGFGLTGAEAIASGAALATTDTKGSRDYALDGSTALVSAPRDPEALARNVLRLLEDLDLRRRLVRTGQRQLLTVMPSWPEAARRMSLALLEG